MPRVVVDGIIFEWQPWGGVARIYREIIPRMCAQNPALRVDLLVNRGGSYGIPDLEQVHPRLLIPPLDRFLRPRRYLAPIIPPGTQAVKQFWTRDLRDAIWHSSYHTSPSHWRGPIVTTVHDLIHELLPRTMPGAMNDLIRTRKRQSILEATVVICDSRNTARDVQSFYGVPAEKIQVIHLAYNSLFQPLTPDAARTIEQPFLLYVGSRERYKNFDMLLDTYANWEARAEFALVIVGRGWSPHEQTRLHELKIEDDVRLFRHISDAALCELYNQAAVFVYPSLYEGFGIPLLEAAACGCPIVSSDIATSVEVAGDVPIYFQRSEVDSLRAALDSAVAEGRSSARAQRGLELAQRYSWDHTAEQTLAIYQRLSGE